MYDTNGVPVTVPDPAGQNPTYLRLPVGTEVIINTDAQLPEVEEHRPIIFVAVLREIGVGNYENVLLDAADVVHVGVDPVIGPIE